MKVCVVIPYFYPAIRYGGPIFASFHLTDEASKLGIKFNVITTNANGKENLDVKSNVFFEKNLFKIKYNKEQIRSYFSFNFFRTILSDISISDVIHIQSIYSYTTPTSLFASYILNKKILISPRGSLASWSFKKRGVLKKIWISLLIKPFQSKINWLATSKKEEEEIQSIFKPKKIYYLPDGVCFETLRLKSNEVNNWSKINYIAAIGRIHKVKGFDLLIQSYSKIISKYPNLHLLIAGDDDGEKDNLLKQIITLNLESKIKFVGNLKDQNKNQFLKHAKCVVVPSHTENFGIVVVEALAQGTPVIASKNTPWMELNEYGAGICTENNVESILDSIKILLSNIDYYKKNTIQLAEKYDWKVLAKKYRVILNEIYNG